jgi:hypothetical protein
MAFRSSRYLWHPQPAILRYVIAFGILVGSIIFWRLTRGESNWGPRIIIAFSSLGALGLLTEQVTWVEGDEQKLRREGRLCGCIRIWRRTRLLSEFRAIAVRRSVNSDQHVTVFVELIRLSGSRLTISYFNESALAEARILARDLARATGLRIEAESRRQIAAGTRPRRRS